MKIFQILTALVVGSLAIYIATSPVRELTIFFSWTYSVPFMSLCLLAFVFLILNIKQYIKYKKLIAFLPFILSSICILITILQMSARESLDNSAASFTAVTYDMGSDGGFILYFKKNGHLKAELQDHWAITYYWGKYSYNNDTIILDIPLNFPLGRKAILTDTSLNFINDKTSFRLINP